MEPFDLLLLFAHSILGFSYDEIDSVDETYILRMFMCFKQLLSLFSETIATKLPEIAKKHGKTTMKMDLPDIREVMTP